MKKKVSTAMSESSTNTITLPSASTVSILINAPIDRLWSLVANPVAWASFSPENVGADVTGDLAAGTTFTGHNAREGNEWTTPCTVLEHQPPHRFAFHAGDDEVGTTWRFGLRDVGEAGVQVSQSFDSLRLRHPDWADMLASRHGQLVSDMQATLAALKAAAEGMNQ